MFDKNLLAYILGPGPSTYMSAEHKNWSGFPCHTFTFFPSILNYPSMVRYLWYDKVFYEFRSGTAAPDQDLIGMRRSPPFLIEKEHSGIFPMLFHKRVNLFYVLSCPNTQVGKL
jgi:hypothetical protein